jgi:NADPH:quinone reductase-like Zn-dependent oxidoreductase
MAGSDGEIRAVQYAAYGGPEVLELRCAQPPKPGPGEVVVAVAAASVNPIDWKVRSGMLQKQFPIEFPATTGRDGAGTVIATAPDVDASLIGANVCFMAPRGVGTWAGQVAIPAALLVKIPAAVSIEQAAAIPLAGISAWIGLIGTGKIASGMRVLIHAAAGGVGHLAVQIARERGAHVIGTCSAVNADFVRGLGAADVIAYDRGAFEQQVRDVDVVFDVIGGDVHARSYKVLKRGGVMACLAAAPYQDQGAAHGVEVRMARVMPDAAALSGLMLLAATGRLKAFVDRVLPLAEFAQAQAHSQSGHARGKTVITLAS